MARAEWVMASPDGANARISITIPMVYLYEGC